MHGKSFANDTLPYKPKERFLDSNNVAKILPVIKFVPAEKFQPYNEQKTETFSQGTFPVWAYK